MIFIDLNKCDEKNITAKCDVCIIGAGAIGIYFANQLIRYGLEVILIEAGDKTCVDSESIGFKTEFASATYQGAIKGRFFGIGGTTASWGGVLVPHSNNDLRKEDSFTFNTWFSIIKTVRAECKAVLTNLGWKKIDYIDTLFINKKNKISNIINESGLKLKSCLYLPFRKRNFVWMLNEKKIKKSNLKIFFNAVANGWNVKHNAIENQILYVNAICYNGTNLQITANKFVIAAGAIESARLLLELNQTKIYPVVRKSSAIGCYLADHLSLPIGVFDNNDIHTIIKLFAPHIYRGWMINYRFLDANLSQNLPRAFGHIIFNNENQGFLLTKKILSSIQAHKFPKISLKEIFQGLNGIALLAYYRWIHSKLFIPPNTKTVFQLDIEQKPSKENCIRLSNKTDKYGRVIPLIHWEVTETDIKNINITSEKFLNKWNSQNKYLPKLVPNPLIFDNSKPYDAYHPTGTCRMGMDNEAVVDENLKVWGISNLWVLSTGVLPSPGTANPTFTILCLAEKLAKWFKKNKNI